MRKIKFRGKRKEGWIEGCYQQLVVHGVMRHFIAPANSLMFDDIKFIEALIEVIPETVGQFTGLTDKNGKEIYEGDIIRIHEGMNDFKITSIVWNDEFLCYEPSNKDLRHALKSRYYKYYEIIGNIHDNPELLTPNTPNL